MANFMRVPGQGRIYKRGKVWYIDYWANGKRIRERSGGSKAAALEELGTKTSDIKRGNLGFIDKKREGAVLFSDFAKEYLRIKGESPKPKRSLRCIGGYMKNLEACFGEMHLAKITPEVIERYQRKRAEDKIGNLKDPQKPSRTVRGASINRELATLRNMFNVARKKKVFRGDNPLSEVVFFPEEKRRHYILRDSNEYSALVRAADPRLRPIIMVAVETGLRKNDILSIKRRDIDFERMTLTAWVSKVQEFQTFKIGEDLAARLKEIRGDSEFLFTNPKTGSRWKDIKKWWADAVTKAGRGARGEFVFHDLRANFGTRVAQKAGAYAAQRLLGHKNAKTTEIYLSLTPEQILAAAKAATEFFKVLPETGGTEVTQPRIIKGQSVAKSMH
jgi:integrase